MLCLMLLRCFLLGNSGQSPGCRRRRLVRLRPGVLAVAASAAMAAVVVDSLVGIGAMRIVPCSDLRLNFDYTVKDAVGIEFLTARNFDFVYLLVVAMELIICSWFSVLVNLQNLLCMDHPNQIHR